MLVLSGALATSTVGCNRPEWGDDSGGLSANNTYTNNQYVHGVGYYHAPYHAWFPIPFNTYQAGRGYYHGGTWTPAPNTSAVMASRPSPQVAAQAQAAHRGAVSRGGFGSSIRSGSS
jgi:hypothetical protein